MKQLTDVERLKVAMSFLDAEGLLSKYEASCDELEHMPIHGLKGGNEMKYRVYIPYATFTEHDIEADNPEQAREIAFDMGGLDKELLDNLEIQYEFVDVEEMI